MTPGSGQRPRSSPAALLPAPVDGPNAIDDAQRGGLSTGTPRSPPPVSRSASRRSGSTGWVVRRACRGPPIACPGRNRGSRPTAKRFRFGDSRHRRTRQMIDIPPPDAEPVAPGDSPRPELSSGPTQPGRTRSVRCRRGLARNNDEPTIAFAATRLVRRRHQRHALRRQCARVAASGRRTQAIVRRASLGAGKTLSAVLLDPADSGSLLHAIRGR